jgi:hypothetical protein
MAVSKNAAEHTKRPTPAPPKKSWSIIKQWTGFTKTSSLVMFSCTAVIFSVFSALTFLSGLRQGNGMKPLFPGEMFWFKDGILKLAMQIHLFSVLREFPKTRKHRDGKSASKILTVSAAGILLPLQFLPVVRRRFMSFHKLAGRLLFVLLLIGDISKYSIVSMLREKTYKTSCC